MKNIRIKKLNTGLYSVLMVMSIMCLSKYAEYFWENINLYSICVLGIMEFTIFKSAQGMAKNIADIQLDEALKELDEEIAKRKIQEEQNETATDKA